MFNLFKNKGKSKSYKRIKRLIEAIKRQNQYWYSQVSLKGIEEFEQLKKSTDDELKDLIQDLSDHILELTVARSKSKQNLQPYSEDYNVYGKSIASSIQTNLLRSNLHYNEVEWISLFSKYSSIKNEISKLNIDSFNLSVFPLNYGVKQIEYFLKNNELSPRLEEFINQVIDWKELNEFSYNTYGNDTSKIANKLKAIIHKNGSSVSFSWKPQDIGDSINKITDKIKDHRDIYSKVFLLASSVSGSKPSKKFSDEVSKLIKAIGKENYRKTLHQLLEVPLYHSPKTQEYNTGNYVYSEMTFLCTQSQNLIKGLVWTCNGFSDKETIHLLTKLSEKTYTKIPGKGPAAASIGNACIFILGNMRGKDGLGALSRLKLKVRQRNVKKTIDKHLLEGSKKYNVSVEELKEMAVPDFKLQDGQKIVEFEDYKLKIFIQGTKVQQQWIKPDGATIKSVPSLIKKSNALFSKLKDTRKEVKELQKVYSAQKQRIDNQFILDREWDYSSFKKYYFDHGLVRPISTKLIWSFRLNNKKASAIFLNDQWTDLQGNVIDWLDQDTIVKLWHPVFATEDEITDWRDKIIELEWSQPIKQAFRELYIITEAEIGTRIYSNRMAAHILKQHQFNSLALIRDWKYSLMGWYDDGRDNEICSKVLPEHQLKAEFWIDEINQEGALNDAGIWFYVSTDQVKFKNLNDETVELSDVPKIVFSEIMRDVDLFVGVSSVGNDPQWIDNNGERQVNRDYWHSYSFGDLSAIAKTRKAILERLLPRLKKIRDKAKIDGKFLRIEGDLRTYKIHIGSGNILMEPNDQYLCIVPSRSSESTSNKVFIPFEGDRGLSIVLSKAFLLAEDTKIVDSTITSQINRKK